MRRFLAFVGLLLLAAVPAEAAKLTYVKGSTSVFVDVFIQDSSSTTGAGLAGLAFNTSSLVCYYSRADQGDAAATQISLVTATRGTYTSSGFKEKDATNMPGVYELGLPTGVLATASNYAIVMCKGATNMAPLVLEIQLTGIDMQDAVHLGITGIPNAAAGASGGILISGSNTGTVTLSDGLVVNRSTSNATAVTFTGNGTGAGLTAISGTGATGNGINATSQATNGQGLAATGNGTGNGAYFFGGGAGNGASFAGNATAHGILATSGGGATGNGIQAVSAATNGHGITATGIGTGSGMYLTSGAGATGDGLKLEALSTNGVGLKAIGIGTGQGILTTGGLTGAGVGIVGGGTSGAGITIATTSGNGVTIAPTAGHGISIAANGTSKHGILSVGGTAGTSNGATFTAGSGGKDLLAATGLTVDACTGCSTAGGMTIDNGVAIVKGATSQIIEVLFRASATQQGLTGVDHTQAGLKLRYCRSGDQGDADCADISPADSTRGAYLSGGVQAKDDADAPGIVEVGIPNAALATGADRVVLYASCTACLPTVKTIELVDVGLTAINSKLGTPAGASMSADTAAVQTSATAIKAKSDSLTFTGSDLGTIVNNYASGKAPLQPTTASRTLTVSALGNASLNWGDVENPTTTVGLTGTTISSSQVAASVTGAVGSVTGAVGSVTGAVGSVTGAVGSVTGAVGSVTGAVGSVTGATASVTNTVKTGGALRKNVASQTFPIYMVLTSDHISAATSKTVTVQVSADGGAFGNITGSVAEIANGWYLVSLSQADINCNSCSFRATAASTDTRNWYVITGP